MLVLGAQALLTDPLDRGRAALRAGDFRSARVDLTAMAAQHPGDAAIHVDLARALNGLGRGAEAERHVARARELGASDIATRVDLAQAVLLQGRARDALAGLSSPVADGDRARAARIAAQAHLQLGDPQAARLAFDQALRFGAGDTGIWIAVARFRLSEQDMLGADAAADRARALSPQSAAALAVKAEVVRTRAGPVAALAWYDAALARDGSNVPILLDYAASLGDAGRYRAMLVPLRRAAGLDPANNRALFLEAMIAARGGEPALARSLFERIAGADADLPAVLQARAAVELALDTPVAAATFARRLLAQQPDNGAARRLLAAALARSDNVRGAIEVIDPITTRADADTWSLLLLADSFAAMGWQTDAIDPMSRAARLARGASPPIAGTLDAGDTLDPARAVPAIRTRLAQGDPEAALGLAQRLAAANPGVAEAQLLVGDAALATGDVRRAAAAFQAAAALKFDEPVMLRLVDAQQRLGDRAGAGVTLAQYLARWPENATAMRVLAAYAAEAGDWRTARDALLAAHARIGPDDALLLAQIGRCHLELGDAAAALPFAQRAYRLLPANATISGVYGLALVRTGGSRRDAQDLLAKAIQLAPGDPLLRRWQQEAGSSRS